MNRTRPFSAATALLLGTAACQQDQNALATPATQVRDSADVRIAENPRPPEGSRLGWEIGAEPTVTIGSADGDDPYIFHRVMSAVTLSDGRIVVGDAGSDEVRTFDPHGVHLASWGGKGEGPGEFPDFDGLARWRGDSIAAWDYDTSRGVSIFDSDGNLGRILYFVADRSRKNITVLRAGALLVDAQVPSGRGTGLRVRHSHYEIRDSGGRVSASFGTLPAAEFFRFEYRGMPGMTDVVFARSMTTAAWRDLAVVSPNYAYEIRAYAADGALRRIVRLDHTPIPATRSLRTLALGEDLPEHLQAMPLPESLPAFRAVMSDALDHLWVREYPVPGRETPGPLWTVFDPEGRVLGYIETPPGLVIHEIGADYILGRTAGDLGVQRVVMWPLRRRSG